ncbi:MAG TPA: peptidylprolyl isomerase, partial [Fimbriiglobus sp.]|nr:peptidylprolyl isomerase [Fimbriiglobus sp.]
MRSFTRRAAAVIAGTAVASVALAQAPAPSTAPAAPPASPTAPPPVTPPVSTTPPLTAPTTPPAGATPPPSVPTTPPAARPAVRPTGVAATINGQEIPEVAVWRALRQFPETEHAAARKEILNHLIENALIDQYLNALKVTVEPAEVDKLIGELKAELQKAMKDYAKELEGMMLTEAEFRTEVSAQMKWDKFLKQQGTDPALKGFFEKRPDIFDGSLVRARHILLPLETDPAKKAAAQKTLTDIKAAVAAEAVKAETAAAGDALAKQQAKGRKAEEVFGEYAKKHSTCPSKAAGGDLQFFPRVGAMVEPFAEAAFKLNVFDISDVVETEFGYHLILCTAKNPGKAKKFEEVKEDVRAVYAMQLRTAVVNQM